MFFYPGGPLADPNNTVTVGVLSGLFGFLLLTAVTAVILGIGIWLCIRHTRKNFKATTGKCIIVKLFLYNFLFLMNYTSVLFQFVIHRMQCLLGTACLLSCSHIINVIISAEYDVQMVSVQQNPAYIDVHSTRKKQLQHAQ